MPEITETIHLRNDADTVFGEIGGFGAIGDWHPMLARVDSEGDTAGSLRRAETTEGATQTERLDTVDAEHRWYRYAMQETQLPVTNYTAEFRVDPADADASTVTWSASFDVVSGDESDGVDMIRQFIRAGLESLDQRYR